MKLLKNDINKLIIKKRGLFLGETTKDRRRIISIQCKNGHRWNTPLYNLKVGKWCLQCLKDKVVIDRFKISKLISLKGYKLLTTGPLSRESRITIECPTHKYSWKTSYGALKYKTSNHNCILCAKNVPSYDDMRSIINSKNGEFVGWTRRTNTNTRNLIVKCRTHNVEFKSSLASIRNSHWCRQCDIDRRKITYEQIKNAVIERNGELLDKCSTATSKFRVRCNKDNYEWMTTWPRIQQGCWCPECSGTKRHTLESVSAFVKNKGGELLSDKSITARKKVCVKCMCGEKFTVTVHNLIRRDVWCQLCNRKSTAQKKLYNIIKELYPNCNYKYNYRGFKWLRMPGQRANTLEIDIFVYNDDRTFTLAIEYDGIQHFRPVRFTSNMTNKQASKAFKEIKIRDKRKNKLISNHRNEVMYFVRLSYKDKITKENIYNKLNSIGIAHV